MGFAGMELCADSTRSRKAQSVKATPMLNALVGNGYRLADRLALCSFARTCAGGSPGLIIVEHLSLVSACRTEGVSHFHVLNSKDKRKGMLFFFVSPCPLHNGIKISLFKSLAVTGVMCVCLATQELVRISTSCWWLWRCFKVTSLRGVKRYFCSAVHFSITYSIISCFSYTQRGSCCRVTPVFSVLEKKNTLRF